MMTRIGLTIVVAAAVSCSAALAQERVSFQETRIESSRLNTRGEVWPRSVLVFAAAGGDLLLDPEAVAALRDRAAPLSVHRLDDLVKAEAALSEGIPKHDVRAAAELIAERLEAGEPGNEVLRRIWLGVLLAQQMRIDRLPAVVFDGNEVVYGTRTLGEAISRYQAAHEGGRP